MISHCFPKVLTQMIPAEKLKTLPQIKIKAHRSGEDHKGNLLIQHFDSTEISHYVDFLKPQDMDNHNFAWFVDPWGRIGVAILYRCRRISDSPIDKAKAFLTQRNAYVEEEKSISFFDKLQNPQKLLGWQFKRRINPHLRCMVARFNIRSFIL